MGEAANLASGDNLYLTTRLAKSSLTTLVSRVARASAINHQAQYRRHQNHH
jgi:hypothetical protein